MNNIKLAKSKIIEFINYTFDNIDLKETYMNTAKEHLITIVENEIYTPIEFMENFYIILKNICEYYMMGDIFNNKNNKEKENNQGYVYLIKAHDKYKIGKTTNEYRRFKEIENNIGCKVQIIYITKKINDYHSLEHNLHLIYCFYNIKGEWFKLNESQVKKCIKLMKKIEGVN